MGKGIWAAGGSTGLWLGAAGGPWQRRESPPSPLRVAQGGGRVAVACAGGEVFEANSRRLLTACPGVEAMTFSPDGRYLYLLSGEADSILCCRGDTGDYLFLNRAGCYPRDARLNSRGSYLAVAAGAAGEVRLFSAPDLRVLERFPVPGVPRQAAFVPGGLAVLAAVEEGEIFTLLGGIGEKRRSFQEWVRLPGLPGGLCLWGDGDLAVSAGEWLLMCRLNPFRVSRRYHRGGLAHYLCAHKGEGLLVSDALMGRASLITGAGAERAVFEGDEVFAQWQV